MTSTERTERSLRDINECSNSLLFPVQTPREWAIEGCTLLALALFLVFTL